MLMGDDVMRLEVSQPRRWLGIGMLAGLGGLLAVLALGPGMAPGYRALLLGFAGGAGWTALRLWAATDRALLLRADALVEEGPDGRVLARMDEVASVSRGALAFKPSNGFVLRLRPDARPGARVWAPGLWWRLGRRVGVGGVLRAAPARAAAEAIALRLAPA